MITEEGRKKFEWQDFIPIYGIIREAYKFDLDKDSKENRLKTLRHYNYIIAATGITGISLITKLFE